MKYITVLCVLVLITSKIDAQFITVNGPTGSGEFSKAIVMLSNGNYVITDPLYDEAGIQDIGAVYLYNGNTHALISTLKGSTASDRVGSSSILTLNNGNFIVFSANWNNGSTTGAGAATWINGTTGLNAMVSSSNSLVGSTTADFASSSILALSNANFIVRCPNWDNGSIIDAGAVAWGNGNTGLNGSINSANSLIGTTANDNIGNGGVKALSNGNYIVISTNWDNGIASNSGAVSWSNGNSGLIGPINSTNSLIGSATNDRVGNEVFVLKNANYVVVSKYWTNGSNANAGAATWGNGSTGISGVVSSSNSMVGSATNDQVGSDDIFELTNSNFIVKSHDWNNGLATRVGALTWVDGNIGKSGVVSSSNSLVGSTNNDKIGNGEIVELSNGNFVISSREWDNAGISNAGAVTWVNGNTGGSGPINSSNSLVGTSVGDGVGYIEALSNGNYVVSSQLWDNGASVEAGAVTWANGNVGINGAVTISNSLVGIKADDRVGSIRALSNGNYVATSQYWDNGSIVDAGAATWVNGSIGLVGTISSTNSLIGNAKNDRLSSIGIIELSNGNYVVNSPDVDNGSTSNTGAITWGNGTTAIVGIVNSNNSLLGSSSNDQIGNYGINVLTNGHYIVLSPEWDNGSITDVGAVTWVNGNTAFAGTVSSSNSLIGSIANDQIGSGGVEVLLNNNYVVRSPDSDNAGISNTGAVTWGNGITGIQGVVSASNSLVGSTASDQVGSNGIIALANGNYVVRSSNWDNGVVTNAGAVTWGNGIVGTSGIVNSVNSLVGSTANDQVGSSGVFSLVNGNYVVTSKNWDNGPIINAAAATWGNGSLGTIGTINSCNSVIGNVANSNSFSLNYDSQFKYYLLGKPDENKYYIFNPTGQQMAPHLTTLTATLSGNSTAPLVTNNCQIIASITPNNSNPINGMLTAKIWLETSQNASFVKRHYEISQAQNAQTATGKVTLYFTQNDFNDFNAVNTNDLPQNSNDNSGKANLRILKYPGISNNNTGLPNSYTESPSTIDPSDADIVWNTILSRWEVTFDVIGFSGFLVTNQSGPLPLNLLSFTGKNTPTGNQLNWQTTNESNFSHFEIERSENAKMFEKIGEKKANKESNNYEFIDQNISFNTQNLSWFYRLKMIDVDGKFSYSKIIFIDNNDYEKIQIYPNPAKNYFSLLGKKSYEKLQIIDLSGRIIKEFNSQFDNNYAIEDIEKGLYLLKLSAENKVVTLKLILE